MGLGLLFILCFWGGLIVLAIWLVRVLFPSANQPPASASNRSLNAREILDLRYARGELSREEYDLMRETISRGDA